MNTDKKTEALKLALEALKGGLWDYGPEQDEHQRCNEVIAICEAALAEQPKLILDAYRIETEFFGLDENAKDHPNSVALYRLAEQPAQQEIEELTAQRDKLADILTRTANALKGQPAELSLHSWHDLPEVAQQLKAAQQQEPVAYVYEREIDGFGLRKDVKFLKPVEVGSDLYISPPASKPLALEQLRDHWDVATVLDMTDAEIDFSDYVLIARDVEALHGIKE